MSTDPGIKSQEEQERIRKMIIEDEKRRQKDLPTEQERQRKDKMEMLSMSSSGSLVVIIIFIGIGMTFNNKTYGIIIGIIASLIIIIPHIYIYSSIFTCNGSDCSGYVVLPFLTIIPSIITSLLLTSSMFGVSFYGII